MSVARGEAVGCTDVRDHEETPDGPQIGPGVSKEGFPYVGGVQSLLLGGVLKGSVRGSNIH